MGRFFGHTHTHTNTKKRYLQLDFLDPYFFLAMGSKFCRFNSFSRNANYKINTMCKTKDKSKDQMGKKTNKLLFTLRQS